MDLRRSVVERKLAGGKGTSSRSASKTGSRSGSRAESRDVTDDEWDGDDGASVASLDSFGDSDAAGGATPKPGDLPWEEILDQSIEALLERKGSSQQSREKSLHDCCSCLTRHCAPARIVDRVEELSAAIAKVLQRARTERESMFCSRLLAVLVFTCSAEAGVIYEAASHQLRTAVRDFEGPAAKAAALLTLSIFTLVLGDEEETRELLDFAQEIVENDGNTVNAPDDPVVVCAALDVLATCCGISGALEDVQLALPGCVDQLDSIDPSVRLAAGEAIALCYEVTAVDVSDEGTLEAYRSDPPYEDTHRLLQLLDELATSSSKKQSKTSRREQHATFRAVQATVSDPSIGSSHAPAETVRFGGSGGTSSRCVLYATTWTQLNRLQLLRRILGGGLQAHLRRNAAVREILGYDGPHPGLYGSEGVEPPSSHAGDGSAGQAGDGDGDGRPVEDPLDSLSKDLRVSINQEVRKQRHRERNHLRKEKTLESSWTADDFGDEGGD